MPSRTHEAETADFDFVLKGKDGALFGEITGLCADVEVTDDECEIVRVLGIFSVQKDFKTGVLKRVYLDQAHQLWGEIEAHILDNEEDLMESHRESEGLFWHTPRTIDEASIIGAGEWRRARS